MLKFLIAVLAGLVCGVLSGFGIGGSILSGAATGDLSAITETAKAYVQEVQGC